MGSININSEVQIPDLSGATMKDVEKVLINAIINKQIKTDRQKTENRVMGLIKLHYGEDEAFRFKKILETFNV